MVSNVQLRDFRSYGRLEAFSVLLVPAVATYYGGPHDLAGGIVLMLADLAMVIGLTVGALYWFAVAAGIERDPLPMNRALKIASVAQRPILILVTASAFGVMMLVATRGWSVSIGAAAAATLLAALEYVNYYHVQLQHFDNVADWRRLLNGRGFRRARLARSLAKWRDGTKS